MVLRLEIKIIGDKETIGKFRTLRKTLPIHMNTATKAVANKIKKEAQINVDSRFKQRSGRLKKSIIVRPAIKRKDIVGYRVGPDLRIARYATVQEAGKIIAGWHFVHREGFGKHGEGYSMPGGQIKIPGRFFMRDAVTRVEPQTKQIMENEINKWVMRSEKRLL